MAAPKTDEVGALLASLKTKTDSAEVYRASSDSAEVRFAAGKVKAAVARETSGVAVRGLKDGRLGFAGSRDLSSHGLETLVTHAANSIEVGDPTPVRFPAPAKAPVDEATLHTNDPATAALGVAELVKIGQDAIKTLSERHPGVVFDAVVRRGVGRASLGNTNGARVDWQQTSFSLGVEANRTQDQDVLLDWASVAAPSRAKADPAQVVEELSRRLTWATKTVPLAPGRMPILFSPSGGYLLWGPLFEALSGKTVMLGTSPLRDRLGQTILDPRVHVTDDGLLPGALGSAPFDDEGTPRRTNKLIDAGVLRSFVHDLETANATGQAPTGNGERPGVLGRPGPGFTTIVIGGGQTPWRDMIKQIGRGLLVHSVVGMGQGNTLPGTFSNPVDLAFAIEGGEVVGRVKDVSIAGNVYELLGPKHLGGFSREVEAVGGGHRLPWIRIDDVNVVGKGT